VGVTVEATETDRNDTLQTAKHTSHVQHLDLAHLFGE
jgi:hypothetical protein